MNAEHWRRVDRIFQATNALDPADRRAAVERTCGDDAALRDEVLELLRCDRRIDFLDLPARDPAACDERAGPRAGDRVGPYMLLERIATGGMGVVHRAVHADRRFAFEVAVKLVRPDVAIDGADERSRRECRALASLRHPNIAHLLDAGSAADGTPYLVMEHIAGRPIDRYCDEQRLSIDERLELMSVVCRAVDFAHRHLVIHRDLKPANILVTDDGVPKLLDFGIAKVLDPLRDEEPGAEATVQLLTPHYASPEQIHGGPVSTATDVYALGVILYHLLAGCGPYRLTGRRAGELELAVRDDPPTRPSSAVHRPLEGEAPTARCDAAQARRTTPERLRRKLRGDLDTIVLVALRKEPERRYASAERLADDLERHRRGLPVRARGDGPLYRAHRFARRHRVAVAAGLMTTLGLVGAAIVSGALAIETAAQRDAARESELRARAETVHVRIESEAADQLARFVLESVLEPAGPDNPWDRAVAAARIEREAARIRREHVDDPHLQANLLDGLGLLHVGLGCERDAVALITEATALRRRTFGAGDAEMALSLRSMARLESAFGRHERAVELLRTALAIHRAAPASAHRDVSGAEAELAAAVAATRAAVRPDAPHTRPSCVARSGRVTRCPLSAVRSPQEADSGERRADSDSPTARLRINWEANQAWTRTASPTRTVPNDSASAKTPAQG